MSYDDATYAFQRLLDWADNESKDQPSTWELFLSLTNNLDDEVLVSGLGYLEGDLLAKALAAWSSRPDALRDFLEA